MAAPTSPRSILVKGSLPPGASFALADGPRFTSEPLFASVDRVDGPGAAPASTWHLVTTTTSTEANGWDLCHALVRQGFGIAGTAPPEFAEPDLAQRWRFGDEAAQALALAGGCAAQPADPAFPSPGDPLWYRDPEHAGFAGGAQDGAGVRVAHLDTGYDPSHRTTPANVRAKLARNFVDPQFPGDATDRATGAFANLGHGTGTLGILAGAAPDGGPPIGAAPGVDVIPVRVADSVVLFRTSAVARGLDYVHSLLGDPATRVEVVTLSLGGLASQAWADAVNALYDRGVCVVAAAGNNRGNLPTRFIVFPARFGRVVAACGVMADGRPYADFDVSLMGGNYGPARKRDSTVAAYTPNVPWAKLGCPEIVNRNGAGTSATTPQVAAAAALWIARHRAAYDAYPQDWMRAEAVRRALVAGAADVDAAHFGRGTLRAAATLASEPVPAADLHVQPPDDASFALWRLLTGLTAAADGPRQRMLALEALQLSQSAALESLLPDDSTASLDPRRARELAQALASHPDASRALREALGATDTPAAPGGMRVGVADGVAKLHLEHALRPTVPTPQRRRLRVYAFDPGLEARLETLALNEATVDVRWEALEPGPVGEYLEVVDVDPPSRSCYAPVDLDDPHLLVTDGRAPSESSAQFHQQMVYAVSMKTIEHFERALGRVALWSPRFTTVDGTFGEQYVGRLRIYPHALREANAFYSPQQKALLFGYFAAGGRNTNLNAPGTLVFGCCSYDIVAHETTHALLDGIHRRYIEPTNPDMLAFHEAFADIVALFQHFTLPEALRDQIAKTRGDLDRENFLGELAVQFGQARGGHGGLRNYIGSYDAAGTWQPKAPSRDDYPNATEAHARGAVLVAAVFDAFRQIYRMRVADLIRLATGGTGVLPQGAISADLVDRLAREASAIAAQWLDICIRALDYCPPVDITFGDYLRALITADRDAVPDDRRSYRVAFVAAFRDRGIDAEGVRHLSIDSLVWEPPPQPLADLRTVLRSMDITWNLDTDRRAAYETSNTNGRAFRTWLVSDAVSDDELSSLGLVRTKGPYPIDGVPGELRGIEVHSVRPALRGGPNGRIRSDLVVEITQRWLPADGSYHAFFGGVTLLIDLDRARVRYFIRKRVDNVDRFRRQRGLAAAAADASVRANYFGDPKGSVKEPFALLHRTAQEATP